MDEFDHGQAGAELLALNKKLSELESENSRLKQIIKDNDLEEEIEDIDCTTLEEKICMDGIRHIASLVESQDYDKDDIKNFDTLYKTLKSIRGPSTPSKTTKEADLSQLLKIVGKDKE